MDNKSKQSIPKNIIQYWAEKKLPENIQILSNSWSKVHPDYNYTLYNKESAYEFLITKYGETVANTFKVLKIPAMQSDFFRIAYILSEGGIYIDMSQRAYNRLDEVIDLNSKDLYICKRDTAKYWNGFIAATSNNNTLKEIFDRIISNISRKDSFSAWHITGPDNFNKVINNGNAVILKKEELLKYFRGDKLYKRNDSHWSKVCDINDVYINEDI